MTRSSDGEGITVGYDVHGCRHGPPDAAYRRAGGLVDEVPDVPTHGSKGLRHETHVMLCDRRRTGKTPLRDHSGARTDHIRTDTVRTDRIRSGPQPVGRAMRGAPDG